MTLTYTHPAPVEHLDHVTLTSATPCRASGPQDTDTRPPPADRTPGPQDTDVRPSPAGHLDLRTLISAHPLQTEYLDHRTLTSAHPLQTEHLDPRTLTSAHPLQSIWTCGLPSGSPSPPADWAARRLKAQTRGHNPPILI